MVKYKRTHDLLPLTLPTTRLPSDLKYYSVGTPLAFQDYLRSMFLSHRDFKGAGTYISLAIQEKQTPQKRRRVELSIYDLWFTFRLQINLMKRCSHAFSWAAKTIKHVSHFEAIWFRECSLVTIRVDEIHRFQTQPTEVSWELHWNETCSHTKEGWFCWWIVEFCWIRDGCCTKDATLKNEFWTRWFWSVIG